MESAEEGNRQTTWRNGVYDGWSATEVRRELDSIRVRILTLSEEVAMIRLLRGFRGVT